MTEEILQVFDENCTPIGELPRSVVKAQPIAHWSGVVNIWLVNRGGEVLCTKRSDTVRNHPGKWQTYVGGHLKAGQSFVDAAIAESDEEVGLTIDPSLLRLIHKDVYSDHKSHFESYAYPFDGGISDLVFNDGEVTDAKWLSVDECIAAREDCPEIWCNGIRPERGAILKEWIGEGRP